MTERWFFALWPDRAARDALIAAAANTIPPDTRPAHPHDWHLTLVFLGPLSPEGLETAVAVADRLSAAPVPIRIDRAGWFARSRALWCGPAVPSPALLELQSHLARALESAGLPAERRPYRAHLTLARQARRPPARDWERPVEWIARELILARGVTGRVPRYAPWRRWPLAGGYDGSGLAVR